MSYPAHRSPAAFRWLRHVLGLACLFAVMLAGYALSLWPQGRGQVRLERLPGPAVVVRDPAGVPCVWASTPDAGFFAMGYVHAQDRLWELELMRRAAWGELAPLVGEAAFPLDVLHRRIGFYRAAFAVRSSLGDSERLLRAYVFGINAYLRAHPARLPPEFLVSRLRPALWQIEDVLAIGGMVEWLSVPCSLRVAGIPDEVSGAGRLLSLTEIPPGLRLFLAPITVRSGSRGDAVRCELSWGVSGQTPWIETGLMVGAGQFRRGWSLPGWPVPQVVAGREALTVLHRPASSPWRLAETEGWAPVMEFLLDTPYGPCDTVRVAQGLSAVAPGPERSWIVSGGAPGFDVVSIVEGLRSWLEERRPAGSLPGSLSWLGIDGEVHDVGLARLPEAAMALTRVEPIVPFHVLNLFPPVAGTVDGPHHHVSCGVRPWLADQSPVSVVIEWQPGNVKAVLLFGQSGVWGSLHRRDQHRAWSRGTLLPRAMGLPDFSRGCALVPLLS